MKLAIIGSRTFEDYELLEREVSKLKPTNIISGGAHGADRLAERYAEQHGVRMRVYLAQWNDLSNPDAVIKTNRLGRKYDALAGIRRNTHIIQAADMVLAFWDGKSPGTRDGIKKAEAMGKKVVVVRF